MKFITFCNTTFNFLAKFNFLAIKMHPTKTRIKTIAKAINPSLDSRLFSWNVDAGKFILSEIIFLSKEDKLIMPSIMLDKKFTLAGS